MAPDARRETPLVLIVDDERDIADPLESYFRLEGYRTLAVYDAAGAVTAARRAPDVILLDVNLPDAGGFSVCREVRELVTCPIIFLTARVEDADALAGFAAGGDDYVTKPFSLDVLGARVRAQLARDRRQLDRATMRFAGGVAVDLARREVRVGDKNPQVALLARKDFDIVAAVAAVLLVGAAVVAFGPSLWSFFTDGDAVRAWVDAQGPLAPVAMGALVVAQIVVAVLPGEPVELAAGYLFGA